MGHDGGWRRGAMGASVTADGGCTNNKMAAGVVPPASPSGTARGCAATPAWPVDERVVLRKERTPRVPCQFFSNVWPFEILAEPHCKANRSSRPYLPSPFYLLSSFRRRISGDILRTPQLLKTTRISNPNISESAVHFEIGQTKCQRHSRCVEASFFSLGDFSFFLMEESFARI